MVQPARAAMRLPLLKVHMRGSGGDVPALQPGYLSAQFAPEAALHLRADLHIDSIK